MFGRLAFGGHGAQIREDLLAMSTLDLLGSPLKPVGLERPLFGHCARQIAPIGSQELAEALAQQKSSGGKIGDVLCSMGLLTRAQVLETLQLQAKLVSTAAQGEVGAVNLPFPCRLSICMPAYNEAENILDTLESAVAILPNFVEDFELVVANDGSSDNTGEIVREYSERCEYAVKLVEHEQNRGYGGAVKTALKSASGDLLLLMDSDGQFNLLDLPPFLGAIQHYDAVVGYRFDRADKLIRKINAAMWTKLISLLLKVKIRDLDCAFKLFRRSDIESLNLESEGASISAEIISQMTARGLRFRECPVSHYPCYHGDQTGANLRVIMKAFQELPRLRRCRKNALQQAALGLSPVPASGNPDSASAQPNTGESLVKSPGRKQLTYSPRNSFTSWYADRPHQRLDWLDSNTTPSMLAEPKLSICLLAACPFPANHGTSGSIREMAEAVSDRGHDVHIVTYHYGEDIDLNGPHMHRIPRWSKNSKVVIGPTIGRMFSDFLLVFKALQIIRRHRPQVIHAHGYEAGIAAWICRLIGGVPVVYSGHNTMSDELASFDFIRPRWLANSFAKFLDRYVPRVGDRCVPHSDSLKDFFNESGLADRSEPVIRFGIDLNWSEKSAAKEQVLNLDDIDGPIILYAGVLDNFQRMDLLLDAMPKVLSKHPDATLLIAVTIVSEKNLQRVKDHAEQIGIADRVKFTDPLDLEGVRQCLKHADVTTIPRPGAPGFPIKLLNYMSASKPCVMFASSACGLIDGTHAILVKEDTSDALADGIIMLLDDEEYRDRLGNNGFDFLLQHHDRRLTAKQLSEVYIRTIMESDRPLPLSTAVATDCWEDAMASRESSQETEVEQFEQA